MVYPFSALFTRMNYIDRWGLMRNARAESLSEHSANVASIAHVLSEIAVSQFGADDVRPERVTVTALYHDISETLTGDMPTPVKYRNDEIKQSYKAVEREAEEQIIKMVPESIQNDMEMYVKGNGLTQREKTIIKAADKIGALIKCIEEAQSGNKEFHTAEESTLASINSIDLPELTLFMSDFLPAYYMTLDELMK
ncbi:MAG: 5'-deoxynucleotidase [Oscillospiraceae bacterium]|nr:5'-deoxynucleotidase [Oscillospiraceae bacterium]